jgi:hypothetical protein
MTGADTTTTGWKSLYRLGAVAALILIVYSLITMVIVVTLGGPPASAQEVMTLLQTDRLVGLLRLDVLTLMAVPLYYLLFLGGYAALSSTHRAYALLAAGLGSAGVTLFLAAPAVIPWLTLSDKYAGATTEAQRTLLLAAGEATLASDMWHGSSPLLGGILMQAGLVLLSVVMLRSPSFARPTAYVGIVTHGLDLARIVIALFIPAGSMVLMAVAGPLYLVWFPLLARDFWRLARANQAVETPGVAIAARI